MYRHTPSNRKIINLTVNLDPTDCSLCLALRLWARPLDWALARLAVFAKIFARRSPSCITPSLVYYSQRLSQKYIQFQWKFRAKQIYGWAGPSKAFFSRSTKISKYWQFSAGPVYRPRYMIKNTFSAEFEVDPSLTICPKQIYLTICVVRINPF